MFRLGLTQVIGRLRVAQSVLRRAFASVYGQDADVGLQIDVRMLPVEGSSQDHNGGEHDARPLEPPEKPRKPNDADQEEDEPECPNNFKYFKQHFHDGKVARIVASAGVPKVTRQIGVSVRDGPALVQA